MGKEVLVALTERQAVALELLAKASGLSLGEVAARIAIHELKLDAKPTAVKAVRVLN